MLNKLICFIIGHKALGDGNTIIDKDFIIFRQYSCRSTSVEVKLCKRCKAVYWE